MLKDRIDLESILEEKCEKIVFNEKKKKNVLDALAEKYNIPNGYAMDCLAGRVDFSFLSKEILYYMTDAIDKSLIEKFFTKIEINGFSNSKYEEMHTIEFPLRLKVIRVNDNFYSSAVDSDFFISLYKDQLIRYNTNTQRTMRRSTRGETEIYKIFVNKKAVDEIAKEMSSNYFISNALTLNMAEDSEAKYYFDKERCELVIEKINYFDILDGYHRLLAMSRCYNTDEKFNYPMIVNIVAFSEQTAMKFISQEDKKTHMKKIDSSSMDINKESNFIVERLNTDFDSNLRGHINRNDGLINYSELSALIDSIYFKKKECNKVELLKELKWNWNTITDYLPILRYPDVSTKMLLCIVIGIKEYGFSMSDQWSQEKTQELIRKISLSTGKSSELKIDSRSIASVKTYEAVKQFLEEV